MAELRIGGKRTDPKPDRRLGIKLAEPTDRRLGGKLNAYVPPGARYDWQTPSVFARYRVLTAVFVFLLVASFGCWALAMRHSRLTDQRPLPERSVAQPESQPVYVEPLVLH